MLGAFLVLALAAAAQETQPQASAYGARGVYPVYETAGQWLIFDKTPVRGKSKPLAIGGRFLVVGSRGSELFEVRRASATYGGACRAKKPARLRAALLRGPRSKVGSPIIGIAVPPSFSLKGSRARYKRLANEVGEPTYQRLAEAIKAATLEDAGNGRFPFKEGDSPSSPLSMKIDFGAALEVQGLNAPFFLVEGSQLGGSFRRCLRLADGDKLVGGCVRMPHDLMAETTLLQFVSYDPSGGGNPYVLAYSADEPLWGHERWGFVVRASGPRLFLADAMDRRCREGF